MVTCGGQQQEGGTSLWGPGVHAALVLARAHPGNRRALVQAGAVEWLAMALLAQGSSKEAQQEGSGGAAQQEAGIAGELQVGGSALTTQPAMHACSPHAACYA